MRPRILSLLLVLATPVQAANLIVPAERPGAELVIANLEAEAAPVVVTYYGAHRTVQTSTLAGHGTLAFHDVPADVKMIRIHSDRDGAHFTAHSGRMPAVFIDALATEHTLSGNVVVANPWTVPASLVVTRNDLQSFHIIEPMDVLAIDATDANVSITSQVGVYAYDDRSLVVATGQTSAIAPRCAEPAALTTAKPGQQSTEDWLVIMNPETPVGALQAELPARHGYMPLGFYTELPGFIAELSEEQIAALRCEAAVQLIAQNVAR